MRRVLLTMGLVLATGGAALALEPCPGAAMPQAQPTVHVVKQQRGLFNAVRLNKDLARKTCNGAEPTKVDVFHTVNDGLAAVFTGILWTPAHLRVTCPPAMGGV